MQHVHYVRSQYPHQQYPMQVPMCSSPPSPIFSRISPIFSPLTTFSGDFQTKQVVIEMEEVAANNSSVGCCSDVVDSGCAKSTGVG